MKAVRGSNRAATKAPRKQSQAKSKKTTGKRSAEEQESELREYGQKTQRNPAKKRTGPPAQTNWQPISRSSINSVENAIDLATLGTLALKKTKEKETQEHLKTIKKRFLADCAKMKVLPRRQKYVEGSIQRHQEETKKLNVGKATLRAVEDDLKAVIVALEKTEEQLATLQNECSVLRDQVEEEEDKAKQMLQKREHCRLRVHFQPPEKDELTLEAQMRKLWPEGDAKATARKLGEILQTSEATQAAHALLPQAHRWADQLWDRASESGSH